MRSVLLFFPLCFTVSAEPASPLVVDRAAIEQVYHEHRTGAKLPFDEAMPLALLHRLVQADRTKESALQQVYGIKVTPALVAAEMMRIDTTTRAPEILAKIKHALGDDPARFGASMARPLLVERLLRQHFDNDDTLHAAQRSAAAKARDALLAGHPPEGMQTTTWHLTPRPAKDANVPRTPHTDGDKTPVRSSSGSYSNEASARVAEVLKGGPGNSSELKDYFEDLDPGLQNVLRAQLRKSGDVSAVIETPASFLVFLAKEISATSLTASCLAIPKRGYDEWLAQQPAP